MYELGPVGNFPPHAMTEVSVEDTLVMVVNVDDKFYVVEALCPHMGGHLARGTLEGTVVTCPLHGSEFDVETGKLIRWTRYSGALLAAAKKLRHPRDLKTYPSSVKDGILYMEETDG